MKFYSMDSNSVLDELKAVKEGLSSAEAEKRLAEYGKNKLAEGKKEGLIVKFFKQMMDPMIIVLIVAAALSGITAFWEGESFADVFIILFVVILNAVLGVIQESKAEEAIEALKTMTAANSKVLRDGKLMVVHSEDLVPGDIVLLEAGDAVPADARILECASMKVEESALTGESVPVVKKADTLSSEKDVPLGDRKNMVYMGSTVVYGRGTVVVCGTGMNTEMGKIADALTLAQEEQTPLQKKLAGLSKILTWLVLGICVVMFAVGVLKAGKFTPDVIIDTFMVAVSLAVAAIPEGLAAVVTIVLSIGVTKMAKRNAVIRKLTAVETLGCAQIICSDKTGTLTQNKMTVCDVYINNETIVPTDIDIKEELHRYFLYTAMLSNDSSVVDGKGIGDPTEYCLLEMVRKIDLDEDLIRGVLPRIAEIPFDSVRKLMSTKNRIHGEYKIFTKGALDVLLDRTSRIYTADGVRDISEKDRKAIMEKNKEFSENGLRVLAFAYKDSDDSKTIELSEENDFIFLGLVSMMDPPRPESAEAVADAKRAGIKPIMITGDHKITATAIAKQIGIFEDGDMALTGMELDAISDAELDNIIEKVSVYARVSPENKIRIVDAWQKKGNIVSMTGDGVNDAPALKKADIGVAMGITGTEVSKDAAAMILTDDNFATIIKAVANGRNVYRNIKNSIKFLLSGNMAGILSVLYTSIIGLPAPFAPVHLLFMNLLTDSLPAIAIGMEPTEKNLLSEKPRDPKESILNRSFATTLFIQGGLIGLATMIAYHIGLSTGDHALASTMAFATLTLARLFHGFNCRSDKSIFKIGFKSNIASVGAFAAGIVFLALVLLVPFLAKLFAVSALTIAQIGTIAGLAFAPTILIQLSRIIRKK